MKGSKKFFVFMLMCAIFVTQLPISVFAQNVSAELEQDSDGYYLIGTVEQLQHFNELVTEMAQADYDKALKEGTSTVKREKVNARLTADIDLNPGLTVSYDHKSGKITLSKDGQSYKMGTGLKNTKLGKFEKFDDADTKVKAESVVKNLGINTWTPISPEVIEEVAETGEKTTKVYSYVGYFDGGGHTIDGVYIFNPEDSNRSNVGFFGRTATSENMNWYSDVIVQNLTIGEHSLITSVREGGHVGGIVGYGGYNIIKNCVNKATIVANTYAASHDGMGVVYLNYMGHVGGIVGLSCSTISECKNYADVISPQAAGGIVGNLMGEDRDSNVMSCENHGNIYADIDNEGSRAGGILVNTGGSHPSRNGFGGYIDKCMNFGKVEGRSAGGIAESISHGADIVDCANRGEIIGGDYASGIVSWLSKADSVALKSCYNAAKVSTVLKSGKAYPIVAEAQVRDTVVNHNIKQCYNDITVCPIESLVGDNVTVITDSYNVPTETFASGEVSSELNNFSGIPASWKQNMPLPEEEGKVPDTYPTLTGTRYATLTTMYCCHEDDENRKNHKKTIYTNSLPDFDATHTPDENGICTHCRLYVNPPVIKTNTLKRAKAGTYYNTKIYLGPYSSTTYEIVKSETDDTVCALPPGLTLADCSYSLEIRGYPTNPGTYKFAIKAKNDYGTTRKNFTLIVGAADKLIITEDNLAYAVAGEECFRKLMTNLEGDALWSIVEGTLPSGVTLNEKSGEITGTISENAEGMYTFTVQASMYGQTASKKISFWVLSDYSCKHEDTEVHAAEPATCQKSGKLPYWSCNICGGKWLDEEKNNEIWDFPNYVITSVNHNDSDGDGECDYCKKSMPVFKKVTSAEDITYGGTYIFVTDIGGKKYVLTAPTENGYDGPVYNSGESNDKMPICEIPTNDEGYFDYTALANSNVMMIKTGFCAECSDLDAGSPRYNLTTIIDNREYSIACDDYSPMYQFYESYYGGKYGTRISLENGFAKVASVYCEHWQNGAETAGKGVLRAFDMTENGVSEKFMSQYPASEYKSSDIKQYDIMLYKMVDVGLTSDNKNFISSDGQSTVNLKDFETDLSHFQGLSQSNVEGISEATNGIYISQAISSADSGSAQSFDAKAYAQIEVVDVQNDGSSEGITEIKYSIKPYISIKDENGENVSNLPIQNSAFGGRTMKVMLCVGSMNPEQIIHFKEDGTKEYFYNKNSNEVRYHGKKSFDFETNWVTSENFVSFEISSFSEIKVLNSAEDENSMSIKSVSQNGANASAEIEFPEVGKYSIIFADYENGKLNVLDCVEKTVEETGVLNVSSVKNITVGTGDKVMIWKSINSMIPLCKSYIVE